MRLVMTKRMVTQVVDALRSAQDLDEEEGQPHLTGFGQFCREAWDDLSPADKAEMVDHLMGVAEYASGLARMLNGRVE